MTDEKVHQVDVMCPACGGHLDKLKPADEDNENTPEPGDFCFCDWCAQPLVFTADMTVRKVQLGDMATMNADQLWEFAMGRKAVVEMIEKRNAERPTDDIMKFIPGGITASDHCHEKTNDNTCSRCRRKIHDDEVPILLWSQKDNNRMWIFCNDCDGSQGGYEPVQDDHFEYPDQPGDIS